MIYAVLITLFISGQQISQIEIVETIDCTLYAERIADDYIATGHVEGVRIMCVDLEMRGV